MQMDFQSDSEGNQFMRSAIKCGKSILKIMISIAPRRILRKPSGLKNRCVSANMPKKIRVGSSENLFIFLQFFI